MAAVAQAGVEETAAPSLTGQLQIRQFGRGLPRQLNLNPGCLPQADALSANLRSHEGRWLQLFWPSVVQASAEVKGRQTRQFHARCWAVGTLQTFSVLIVTVAGPTLYFHKVRNGGSERLINLSKDTQLGRSKPEIPAPVFLPLPHMSVASGPPSPLPGNADGTVSSSSASPPSYWALLLIFSPTAQQAIRVAFLCSAGEAWKRGMAPSGHKQARIPGHR